MTNTAWEQLSDQAVAMCGIVYFLALIAHLVEWSLLRTVPVDAQVLVTAGSSTSVDESPAAKDVAPVASRARADKVAMFRRLGVLLTILAVAIHFVALLGRGMAADPNRVPWGNMYEFTMSGSFVVALFYLLLYRRFQLTWLSPLVVGFVVAVLMIDVIWLHERVAPLTEALSSYWLVIHVVSAVLATGAFTLAGMTSALYLVKQRHPERTTGYVGRLPAPRDLDRIAYRLVAFGFPVWTFAALITGPIWAHEAWSSYWNWDPKEVWAFITWVVFAAYLHARSTAGWKGRNAAILCLVGLATLWFNFIGINYFSTTSQHSYAAPDQPTMHPVVQTVVPRT